MADQGTLSSHHLAPSSSSSCVQRGSRSSLVLRASIPKRVACILGPPRLPATTGNQGAMVLRTKTLQYTHSFGSSTKFSRRRHTRLLHRRILRHRTAKSPIETPVEHLCCWRHHTTQYLCGVLPVPKAQIAVHAIAKKASNCRNSSPSFYTCCDRFGIIY